MRAVATVPHQASVASYFDKLAYSATTMRRVPAFARRASVRASQLPARAFATSCTWMWRGTDLLCWPDQHCSHPQRSISHSSTRSSTKVLTVAMYWRSSTTMHRRRFLARSRLLCVASHILPPLMSLCCPDDARTPALQCLVSGSIAATSV